MIQVALKHTQQSWNSFSLHSGLNNKKHKKVCTSPNWYGLNSTAMFFYKDGFNIK